MSRWGFDKHELYGLDFAWQRREGRVRLARQRRFGRRSAAALGCTQLKNCPSERRRARAACLGLPGGVQHALHSLLRTAGTAGYSTGLAGWVRCVQSEFTGGAAILARRLPPGSPPAAAGLCKPARLCITHRSKIRLVA